MFRSALPSLLLAASVTALPAVQEDATNFAYTNSSAGFAPSNGTTEYMDLLVGGDGLRTQAAAAYDLVASYTASNWFSSFTAQALGVCRHRRLAFVH